MKIYSSFIYIAIFIGLILVQPVCAKLVASYCQAVIIIDQVEDSGKIIAEGGGILEVNSPELIKEAKAFKKQQIRVLYMVMGEKKFITELKPVTAPPFTIPERMDNSNVEKLFK